jgi:hypothetical protein
VWAVRGGKVVFLKGAFVEFARLRLLVVASLSAFLLFACVEMARADVASDLLDAGITPAGILYVLTWGMGIVLKLWAAGYAVGWAVKVIKAA